MRRLTQFAMLPLCVSSTIAAAAPLPVTSSLGASELPIRDAAEFIITPSEVGVVRSTDSIVGIQAQFTPESDTTWAETFKIPDGKLLVITQFELPETEKSFVWLERMADNGADIGWTIYSASLNLDFQGAAKPLAPLATPLVLAPGKTFKLHSNAVGVSARGYYLEESTSQ
jgi:hypothetical protein